MTNNIVKSRNINIELNDFRKLLKYIRLIIDLNTDFNLKTNNKIINGFTKIKIKTIYYIGTCILY